MNAIVVFTCMTRTIQYKHEVSSTWTIPHAECIDYSELLVVTIMNAILVLTSMTRTIEYKHHVTSTWTITNHWKYRWQWTPCLYNSKGSPSAQVHCSNSTMQTQSPNMSGWMSHWNQWREPHKKQSLNMNNSVLSHSIIKKHIISSNYCGKWKNLIVVGAKKKWVHQAS